MPVRILFLADTHLGIDLPSRPRIKRRRRGPDFFENYERALEPAFRGEVDCVIHGGDVLYRSKVPAALVEMAFEPLRRLAETGVPVYVIPGNHERSFIPYPLFASHSNIHLFDRPRTYTLKKDGLTISLAGFPFVRNVRNNFTKLLDQTGYRQVRADTHILCIHQCVEGATVGPKDYTFRYNPDVIRAADIPGDLLAVLSGHIHRFQVLTKDLRGRPIRAPVFFSGSTERTSFAEMGEKKGYITLEICDTEAGKGDSGGSAEIGSWKFHELPVRPMIRLELEAGGMGRSELQSLIRRAIKDLPDDSIVNLRISGRLSERSMEVLRAGSLRSLVPPTLNVSLSLVDQVTKA